MGQSDCAYGSAHALAACVFKACLLHGCSRGAQDPDAPAPTHNHTHDCEAHDCSECSAADNTKLHPAGCSHDHSAVRAALHELPEHAQGCSLRVALCRSDTFMSCPCLTSCARARRSKQQATCSTGKASSFAQLRSIAWCGRAAGARCSGHALSHPPPPPPARRCWCTTSMRSPTQTRSKPRWTSCAWTAC